MKKINCKECVFSPFKQWSKNKVEVIRCKDCKYFCPDEKWDKDSDYCFCRLIGIEMTADDFCSRGEREDE